MAAGPALKMWSRDESESSSPDGIKRTVRYREAYTVTLAASDPIETAYSAVGLPLVGSIYPNSSSIYCTSVKPRRTSPILATVDIEYVGEYAPEAEDTPGESPATNAPPEISWTDVKTDEPVDEDFDGNPIVTANDEPIMGVTTEVADQVVTIKKNYLAIDLYAISEYRRSVNSDYFLGWPPGTARLIAFSARKVTSYWEVTAQIQFRRPYRTTPDKAWYKRVRHEGFYVKDSSGRIVRAVDDNKEPVTRPVLLAEDGTREENSENAHWLEFKVFGELPYNALGLV